MNESVPHADHLGPRDLRVLHLQFFRVLACGLTNKFNEAGYRKAEHFILFDVKGRTLRGLPLPSAQNRYLHEEGKDHFPKQSEQ